MQFLRFTFTNIHMYNFVNSFAQQQITRLINEGIKLNNNVTHLMDDIKRINNLIRNQNKFNCRFEKKLFLTSMNYVELNTSRLSWTPYFKSCLGIVFIRKCTCGRNSLIVFSFRFASFAFVDLRLHSIDDSNFKSELNASFVAILARKVSEQIH